MNIKVCVLFLGVTIVLMPIDIHASLCLGLGLIYEWILPAWVMYVCSKICMILIDHETLDSDENGKSVMQNQELFEYKSKRMHETCTKYNFIVVNVKKVFNCVE